MTNKSSSQFNKYRSTGFTFIGLMSIIIHSTGSAYLNVQTITGEKIFTDLSQNICVIPNKINTSWYSEGDLKKELKLCQMNIENPQSQFVSCPKLHNTNPGLEIYEISPKINPEEWSSQNCALESKKRTTKIKKFFNKEIKIATKFSKYKVSTSCGYAPAAITYYHLSRYFGDILNVPVSVLATLNKSFYIQKGETAKMSMASQGASNKAIPATWNRLLKTMNQPESDERSNLFLTSDLKQTWGTLSFNPNNEEAWSELSNDAGGIQDERAKAFMRTQEFMALTQIQTVENLFQSGINQNTLQQISTLQDISNMILIDTLLGQEDRYNNIAYEMDYFNIDDNHELQKLKKEDRETLSPSDYFSIKKMVLKDNECALAQNQYMKRTNINKKFKILESIVHFNQETYSKLQELNQIVQSSQEKNFKNYIISVSQMTESDYQVMKQNIIEYSSLLKSKCKSNLIKLDLSLKSFVKGEIQNNICH